MKALDQRRYTSLLAEVSVTPGAGVVLLRRELETVHGIVVSAVRLRADLELMVDAGLLRWDGEAALCTERGMDVARMRAPMPELS